MKNNILNFVLISLITIIFFGYFLAQNLIFEKDITEDLKLIETYAMDKDWDKVLKLSTDIKKSWGSKKNFIMLNYAETDFAVFENHLNYIIGGAQTQQLDTVLTSILAVQDIWENVNKIVPEP